MAQIGNKQNSYLNGEWGKHASGPRKFTKRLGSKRRRKVGKNTIKFWDGEHRGREKR